MTAWTAFASVAGVVTVLLLLLAHTTSERFAEPRDREGRASATVGGRAERRERDVVGPERRGDGFEGRESEESEGRGSEESEGHKPEAFEGRESESGVGSEEMSLPGGRERVAALEFRDAPELSQSMLLLNVAFSQGVFGVVLVLSALVTDVPRAALGVASTHLTPMLAVAGVALGAVLYVADEVGASMADAAGFGRSEGLREFLAPESLWGWVILLGGVLPVVAGFEELLFRGVLVGALSTGFGVSPWVLAVGSSVLFGLGHGAQGRLGVVVTTALGFVFAVAYVFSGSLLVVVVAHYLVNALEFVVHEGLGVDGLA